MIKTKSLLDGRTVSLGLGVVGVKVLCLGATEKQKQHLILAIAY